MNYIDFHGDTLMVVDQYAINAINNGLLNEHRGLLRFNNGILDPTSIPNSDDFFINEEAYAIKKVMTSFAEVFKTTLREIGAWLVWLAHKLAKFNDRELYRADKEVKDIADGRYDGQIRKVENGYGGGMSR